MLFILASTSPIKIKALERSLSISGFSFSDPDAHIVQSTCPITKISQPIGSEEGYKLCDERLNEAFGLSKKTTELHQEFFVVAIESFVFKVNGSFHDQAWVMVRRYTRNHDAQLSFVTRCVTTCSLPMPFKSDFKLDKPGQTYGENLKSRGIIKDSNDPHSCLLRVRKDTSIDRAYFLSQAIKVALRFYEIK